MYEWITNGPIGTFAFMTWPLWMPIYVLVSLILGKA